MRCPNCGAKYPDSEIRCPHCHSENVKMAEKRKEDLRKSFDREAEQMKQELPKKNVKKIHVVMCILLAGILCLTVLGILFLVVWGKYSAKIKYDTMQKHMAKMEKLLEAEDYEGFFEYADRVEDLWEDSYEKYHQLQRVGDRTLKWMYSVYAGYQNDLEDGLEWMEEAERQQTMTGRLVTVLEEAAYALSDLQQYIYDRAILGNERLLKEWETDLLDFLETKLGLSEEEIETLKKYEGEDEAVLQQMAEQILDRDLEKK